MEEERKYKTVANELRDDILSGKYAPGKPFPSVKMICRRFGVSHLTAVKAVESLKGRITIVLTTHYMEEAEALSDRIAVMLAGRLAAEGTLAEIEEKAGAKGLENAFVTLAGEGRDLHA